MGVRMAISKPSRWRLEGRPALGIRPKVIFWIGWPVTEFMMVATMLMAAR